MGRLCRRLRNNIEALLHHNIADEAPSDPLERQDYLAALALLAIVEGNGTSSWLADVTVLIDDKTLIDGRRHDHSLIDVGFGRFGLPIEAVRRWACIGTITPVVVAADGTRIYLGREPRLATGPNAGRYGSCTGPVRCAT